MSADRDLAQMLTAAIEAKHFNWMEMYGFKLMPKNALLAGAAIGYGIGIEEGQRKIEELVKLLPKDAT